MNKKFGMLFGPSSAGKTTMLKNIVDKNVMDKKLHFIPESSFPFVSHQTNNFRIYGNYVKNERHVGFADYYATKYGRYICHSDNWFFKGFNHGIQSQVSFLMEHTFDSSFADYKLFNKMQHEGYEIKFFFIENGKKFSEERLISDEKKHRNDKKFIDKLLLTINLHYKHFHEYESLQKDNIVILNTKTTEDTLNSIKVIENYFDL